MGVVKQKKAKAEKELNGKEKKNKEKVKKKRTVSCLQCIKPVKDGTELCLYKNNNKRFY